MLLRTARTSWNKWLSRPFFFIIVVICMGGLSSSVSANTSGILGAETIGLCDEETYTYSFKNTSGNLLASLEPAIDLSNLTGFAYVPGSASLKIDSAMPFCQADPVAENGELVWRIDPLCSQTLLLDDSETLNVQFNLKTGCNAVGGTLKAHLDYVTADGSGTSLSSAVDAFSMQVLPGRLSITKSPNVIPQEIGQEVTWTVTVENTGLGTVTNAVIKDVLGDGLQFVSAGSNGANDGQVTTWSKAEIPALASLDPGDLVSVQITARVVGSQDLQNKADVRWGCDISETAVCQDTETGGGTAFASVETIIKTPLLDFDPPAIDLAYCQNEKPVAFTITNIGDGSASNIRLYVDFSPFTVEDVSAGAVYNSAEKRFELTDHIANGDAYALSFSLRHDQWCGINLSNTKFTWKPIYEDNRGTSYALPVKISSIIPPLNTPNIELGLSGAPQLINIGGTVTYTVTSAQTGVTTCAAGTCGPVTVIDTVPAGLTVVDAGGGVWAPGTGGAGGTVTWTYTPPAVLNTTLVLQLPGEESSAAYCGQSFTNSISASENDCCGCSKSAAASQTTAIACEKGLDAARTIAPVVCVNCSDLTYTNTYTFDGGSASVLSDLDFEDFAEREQEYNNGLAVTFDGSNITGCVTVTDTTPGSAGSLRLDFSGCAATSLAGKTLTITYLLNHADSSIPVCQGTEFLSWSELRTSEVIAVQASPVSVEAPAMAVNISGLGETISKGETKAITMILTQTSSTADPRDVKLKLSGLNYGITDLIGIVCGGDVSPVSCNPVIDGNGDYIWTFNDGFTGAGQDAVIQLDVTKRCTDSSVLTAIAYYDDQCGDDAAPDERCSVVDTQQPLLLGGDVQVEVEPEIFYTNTNQAEWTIYLTNRGSGTANNVWLDGVLGSGLDYVSAVVDDMTGVAVMGDQDHEGSAINGASAAIADMTAGERRQITYTADLIGAQNLTLDVAAAYGAIGSSCQLPTTDTSTVLIGKSELVASFTVASSIDAGSSPTATVILRNAGQTTNYNSQVTVTLPAGLLYPSGTTRWRLNSGAWNGPHVDYDPNPTISPLKWTKNEISGLAALDPGDAVEIEFDLYAGCPFMGGDVVLNTQYENPAGIVSSITDSVFNMVFNEPEINIDITRADQPVGTGDSVEWTITVTNQGDYTLPVVWVQADLGSAFTYSSSTGDSNYTGDNGTPNGQVVTWEIQNIGANETATLKLTAVSDTGCSPDLETNVSAWCGLGFADGSSATKPGEDAPDNNLCLNPSAFVDSRTETREPLIEFSTPVFIPAIVKYYGESTVVQVAVENTGPTDASDTDMVITLPNGLIYNAGSSLTNIGGVTGSVADPTIAGNILTYFNVLDKADDVFNQIEASDGDDTGLLEFGIISACPQKQAEIGFVFKYYDACGDTQYSRSTSASLAVLAPELTVTQTFPEYLSPTISASGVIRVTNTGTSAGGGSTNEHFKVTEILPSGLAYQAGSTKWRLVGGEWHGPDAQYDPAITGNTLEWFEQQLITPDLLPPNASLEISFAVVPDNSFSGGDLKASAALEVENQSCTISSEVHSFNLKTKPSAAVAIDSVTPAETVAGEPYIVQVTVSGSQGVPTGEVAVSDGSASCNLTLVSGSGSCELISTTAGIKTITAAYNGDPVYSGNSTSDAHTVNPADTSVQITTVNPSPSQVGEPYWVSFTLQSVLPGRLTPTGGNVAVTDGTGESCTAALVNGSGSCALTSTSGGTKILTASYAGTSDFKPSSNSGTLHQVNPADTGVNISAISPEPSAKDALYNVAVSVAATLPSTATPGGNVLVDDGEGNTCSITLTGGSGSCDLISTTAGSKTITASFIASSDFNGSTAAANHLVASLPDQLLLSRVSVSTLQTVVGVLSTNGGESPYAYALESSGTTCDLVNGAGNSSFIINNDQLERQPSTPIGEYPVCIQVKDALGSVFQKAFTIIVTAPPTNLVLSNSQVSTAEQIVGLFSASGGQSPIIYTLETSGSTCDSTNSAGNSSFTILDRALLRKNSTPAGNYPICVQLTDQNGESTQQTFTITVVSIPVPPVLSPRISLSGSTLIDGDRTGTIVGSFTSTIPGTVFSLIDGTILPDTSLFSIVNNQLFFYGSADIHSRPVYLLRAMGTASNSLTDTLDILVTVKGNGLLVSAVGKPDTVEILSGQTFRVDVTANDSWSDGASSWSTLEIVTKPQHGTATVGSIIYTADASYTGQDEVVYRACDNLDNCVVANVTFNVLPKPEIEDFPELPQTGFSQGVVTEIGLPSESLYFDLGFPASMEDDLIETAQTAEMRLEIPRLKLITSVVGVPLAKDGWNVTWLGASAGWLEGSAFPTLPGNSVLTAHVVDANGLPGPFIHLNDLRWGDEIIIHAWGETYVYQVRSVEKVKPDQRGIFSQQEQSWLTLLTCAGYDENQAEYRYRIVVKARLERVE